MVVRIIEQQQAICAVLAKDRKNWHRIPSETDISVLETFYMVLKPLSTLTDALSGKKQFLSHSSSPETCSRLAHYRADRALATQMKTAISTDLQWRNNSPELGHLIDKASFLDPRFRDQYLENKDGTIDCVKAECLPLVSVTSAPVAPETDPDNIPPMKKHKGLAAVL